MPVVSGCDDIELSSWLQDMFHNLSPVSGGIGMKLLQKMGWKPGQVIGKRGEGYAEPIALTVKIDRKGLSAGKEKATKKGAPTVLDLQGNLCWLFFHRLVISPSLSDYHDNH